MIGEHVQCDREGCEEWFDKKTHNQRYHDDECCRLATNARIMRKYYARRDQRQGKARYCSDCKVTKLSRYNNNDICSACQMKNKEEINKSVSDMLLSTTWAS